MATVFDVETRGGTEGCREPTPTAVEGHRVPAGDDPVTRRPARRTARWRATAAVVAAALAFGGVAAGADAQPAPPAAAQPPADNVFPVPTPYPVTYSDSWHACRDGCSRPHRGNDLMADEGAPLVAVEAGVIVRSSDVDRGLGGITLWLRGDSGVAYYYAHNAENLVAVGQRVARGQMIARVGRTGNARSTAAHVHFQVNLCGETNSTEPCTVDPYPHLQTWAQGLVDGGVDGIGWYQPSTAAFGRRNESGSPLSAVGFGAAGVDAAPVAGDWDGDGRDSVGLYSRTDATFSLQDDEGAPLPVLSFGEAGRPDVWPIAGDFDGDGRDTVGLYRQAEGAFVVLVDVGVESAPVALGPAGRPDVLPIVGDWDGDGRDSLGVYQQADGVVTQIDDDGAPLAPTTAVASGPAAFPLAGDWDGDGRDDVGVLRRDASVADLPTPDLLDPAAVRTVPVEGGADVLPVAGDWNGRDLVTQDELRQIFGPVADDPKVVEGLPALNAAMLHAGISTPARKAAFLATLRSESAFRYDAVEAGNDSRYRGRGFIQITGAGNYRAAGAFLGLDLAGNPDLAINGLASPAIAAWYWTVARNINVSADALDMAAVNIAIGFAPSTTRDMLRCGDFLAALRYYSGGEAPPGVNCERTSASRALAFSAILPSAFRPGPTGPGGTVTLPPSSVPPTWAPTTTPSVAPTDPAPPATAAPAPPQTSTSTPAPPSTPPPAPPATGAPTTATSASTTSTTAEPGPAAPSSTLADGTTTTSASTTTTLTPDSTTTTDLLAPGGG